MALTGAPTDPADSRIAFDDLDVVDSGVFLKTRSPGKRVVDYSSFPRLRAWRNAMVAAINAALARRLLSLRPGDDRWPGAGREPPGQGEAHVFRFEVEGIPAVASLRDAGFDEVSVHVALWPTQCAERLVVAANAGFHAGELFASGWLERRIGAWLQVPSDLRGSWSFRCRKARLAEAAALAVRPSGYADSGRFLM